MKLNISYRSKGKVSCPTCRSDKVVLIIFKPEKVTAILKAVDKSSAKLISSDMGDKNAEWLCKNCYDLGEVLV